MTAHADTQGRYSFKPAEAGLFEILDAGSEREAAKSVQCMNALALANHMRLERARIKREIHDATSNEQSREQCAAVIEDNPPAIASMRVETLQRSIWHEGPRRRRLTIKYVACSAVRTVGELTPHQRERFAEALRMTTEDLHDAVMFGRRP